MGKQPVNARNADIVKPPDAVAEQLCRKGCLLGCGDIARAARADDYLTYPVRLTPAARVGYA